jgi:hypothetical protein
MKSGLAPREFDATITRHHSANIQYSEPVSKPRRSRRREEADTWETKGIRLLTSAATSFRKGFEIASSIFNFQSPCRPPARCVLAGFLTALAGFLPLVAAEPVTTRSQSGQFIVRGLPMGAPVSGYSTSAVQYLRLDPTLTAVSLERIRQAMLAELGLPDEWRGLITVSTHPVERDDPSARFVTTRYTDGWGYRLELPERMDKSRFINAAVRVVLMEIANRSATTREAELPPWLAEGLAAELQATSLATLALEPETRMVQRGGADVLRGARQILRRRPALRFDELNMPSVEQASGDNAELYRACAHLFVHELLQLRGGRDCLRDMVRRLPENLNWQTTFLRAFAVHFPRLIDADKWYSLSVVHLSGRDLLSALPDPAALTQLDDLLVTPVQVRLQANELPIQTSVTLQRLITEWEFARQQPVLRQKAELLLALRQRASPDLASLVEGYALALQTYANGKPPKRVVLRDGQMDRARLPTGVKNLLKQLDELDARRERQRERVEKETRIR